MTSNYDRLGETLNYPERHVVSAMFKLDYGSTSILIPNEIFFPAK